MSDIEQVLARLETDYGFYLAVLDIDGHAQRARCLNPELNVVGQRRSRIRGEGVEPEGFS
jgi:hypothetical protein